jgi:hypothetical protein
MSPPVGAGAGCAAADTDTKKPRSIRKVRERVERMLLPRVVRVVAAANPDYIF